LKLTMADSATNDTLLTADNLGVITDAVELSGTLDQDLNDLADFYVFTLAENSSISIGTTLTGESVQQTLIADLNSNGFYESNERIQSDSGFFGSGFLTTILPAGTYYLLFDNASEAQYSTRIAVTSTPNNIPRDPGSSLDDNPLNLGVLSGRRIVRDYVGGFDEYDYYQFRLTEKSNLSIRMTSNSFFTGIRLISDDNSNGILDSGEVIRSTGGTDSSFTESLDPSTYFIEIQRGNSSLDTGSLYEVTLAQTPDRTGNDVIRGTARRDRINGESGNDRIFGLGGNDVLIGGLGNDRLIGGSGNDFLNGAAGNDIILGGTGRDNLVGSSGDDRLTGGSDSDVLNGGAGRDRIDGQSGNDTIRGGAGNDILIGGTGNDRIDGEAGNDIITTGSGRDRIVVRRGRGRDRVTDFQNNLDKFDLIGIQFNQLTLEQQRDDVLVKLGRSTLLVIDDTRLAAINRADFV
jgi:Ca2+-binding RTX toxin-like protein